MIKESSKFKAISEHGYVYIIKCQEYCKIGITSNIKARMSFIGVNIPYNVELIHSIKSSNMKETERLLHEQFRDKRVKGEWFKLSKGDIKHIKSGKYSKKIIDSIGIGFPANVIPEIYVNNNVSINEINNDLTLEEVSKFLKIHIQTVRRWIKERKITSFKLEGLPRVTIQSINDFISKNEIIINSGEEIK